MPLHIVDHPLVHDALVSLRDKRTPPEDFRRGATRISVLLAAEALKDVPTREITVETPLGPAPGRRITADVVVVPVLRAGLGMLDAVLELVPGSAAARAREPEWAEAARTSAAGSRPSRSRR